MTKSSSRARRIEDPDMYVRSTVLTDATSLRDFVRSLCENYPVSEDVRFIDYLLGLVVLAAKGEVPDKNMH
jgi:hypothetical protein